MIAPSMSHVFREPPGSKKQDPLKTIFFNFLLFTKNIFRDLCCCCCWKETLIETPHLPKNAQIFCLELEYLTRLLTSSRSLCLSDCELCDVIVGYLLSLISFYDWVRCIWHLSVRKLFSICDCNVFLPTFFIVAYVCVSRVECVAACMCMLIQDCMRKTEFWFCVFECVNMYSNKHKHIHAYLFIYKSR